jgi:hypothetical protein
MQRPRAATANLGGFRTFAVLISVGLAASVARSGQVDEFIGCVMVALLVALLALSVRVVDGVSPRKALRRIDPRTVETIDRAEIEDPNPQAYRTGCVAPVLGATVILSPFAPVAFPVAATFVFLVTVPALALVLLALADLVRMRRIEVATGCVVVVDEAARRPRRPILVRVVAAHAESHAEPHPNPLADRAGAPVTGPAIEPYLAD